MSTLPVLSQLRGVVVKEAELQKLVLRQARIDGWSAAHFGSSVKWIRRGDAYKVIPDKDAVGFPDLVLVRYGQLIFAELKSERGRIRDEQALWLADLREVEKKTAGRWCCVQVFVWRPEDWFDGSIQEVLA